MGSRDKLLDAACASFGRNGYQATSVDALLEATRVSPSNFYYHFESKEALARAALERTFEGLRRELAPIFADRSDGAIAQLERLQGFFVGGMTKSRCTGGCPLGNLAQELSDVHAGFRDLLARFFEEWMREIEGVVRRGRDAGEIRPDAEPRATACLLFGSLEGLVLLSKSLRDVAPLDRGFRQALGLLRREKPWKRKSKRESRPIARRSSARRSG